MILKLKGASFCFPAIFVHVVIIIYTNENISVSFQVIREKKLAFSQNKTTFSSDFLKTNDEEEEKKSIEKDNLSPFIKDDLDDDDNIGEK